MNAQEYSEMNFSESDAIETEEAYQGLLKRLNGLLKHSDVVIIVKQPSVV